MYRQLIILLFLIVSISGCANHPKAAAPKKATASQPNSLALNCTVMAQDFSQLKDTLLSKQTVISGLKHQPGGAVQIATIEPYEFWVMVHGMVIDKPKHIINYQVAIKDRRTDQFMHAMSDTSPGSTNPPKSARISLVEYHPNSMLEKGELLFECK